MTTKSTGHFEDGEHGLLIPGTAPPAPCPFCGSIEVQVAQTAEADDDLPDVFNANCASCDAEGPNGETRLEAAQRWNERREAVPAAA